MSNLLPEKALLKIRHEYRERFMLTGSSLAVVAAVFFALALSPSFGVLFISRPTEQALAVQAQQSRQDNADIERAQSLVSQLSPIATVSSSTSNAILDALAFKPSGVHVNNIVYNPGSAGSPGSITIGGVADSRADTDKYRTQLQADPNFSSVKLPVDELLGAQGGHFTITLSGHF